MKEIEVIKKLEAELLYQAEEKLKLTKHNHDFLNDLNQKLETHHRTQNQKNENI